MKIPTRVPKEQFHAYIEPHLSKAKRGYVSKQPLWKIDIIPFQDNTFAEAYLPLNMRDVRT